jgi:hypothetical protein
MSTRSAQGVVFRQLEAHDGGAEPGHSLDHAFHHAVDLDVALGCAEEIRHHADARAFEGIRAQRLCVALRLAADAEGGDGIGRINSLP